VFIVENPTIFATSLVTPDYTYAALDAILTKISILVTVLEDSASVASSWDATLHPFWLDSETGVFSSGFGFCFFGRLGLHCPV
jgi:hypothetical protein